MAFAEKSGSEVGQRKDWNQATNKPLSPDDIIVSCTLCSRVLYRGTARDARHLILYCDECPA